MLHSIAPTWWPPTFHFVTPAPADPVVSRPLKSKACATLQSYENKGTTRRQAVDDKANLVELVIMVNLVIWPVIRDVIYPGVGAQLHFL